MIEILSREAKEVIARGEVDLVDVRTPDEFSEGRILGAVNINIYDPLFLEKIKKLDPDKQYLVYCRGGGRSAQACLSMQKLGYKKVINLLDGILGWEGEGFFIER